MPVFKALTVKACIVGLQEGKESLGGIGYLEINDIRFDIARLFRDASILSIWEGTTDVVAADVVGDEKGEMQARYCLCSTSLPSLAWKPKRVRLPKERLKRISDGEECGRAKI